MKNKTFFTIAIVIIITIAVGVYVQYTKKGGLGIRNDGVQTVTDPLDAAYFVDGRKIKLEAGVFEAEMVPGSAETDRFLVFGQPVLGDIDGDSDIDVGLLITRDGGGSGTFYYAAVALNDEGEYTGTNAIFLGDRIAPQTFEILNEIFTVNYAVRKDGEPMTASPSVGVSKYMTVEAGNLVDAGVLGAGEMLISGSLVYGHEARSITPCGGEAHWIMGSSPVLNQIKTTYENAVGEDIAIYKPIFVSVIGNITEAPSDGFGADYDSAILVSKLVRVPSAGVCR